MTLKKINIQTAIQEAEKAINTDKSLSPSIKSTIKMLIMLITLLASRLNLTSKNSSKPPADDKNRKRGGGQNKNSNKKPGGQNGHVGVKLKKVACPDRIETLTIDKRTLPKGEYKEVGFESRQVFDIEINRVITEYRAQILEDQNGKRYVAEFPANVKTDVQYGIGAKVNSVYMSQFQLLPYNRIQDQFADQMQLPLSVGTIFNFNEEAYLLLSDFDVIAKEQLIQSKLMHNDETGININKKKYWLHSASNEKWTYFYPHEKRGSEAMDEIGILPKFLGVSCHDHWKPYFQFKCKHGLCNTHHSRELIYHEEQYAQEWAEKMKGCLFEIKQEIEVYKAAGKLKLPTKRLRYFEKKYDKILQEGLKEIPAVYQTGKKKGKPKQHPAKNLADRLIEFRSETLAFMYDFTVPFTNNQGEQDIRMNKVKQKISGCFRSLPGV